MTPELEQLMMLKEVTNVTGILHEAQVLQLKSYVIGILGADKHEVAFDWENKKVIYIVKSIYGRRPKQMAKRLKLLRKCVNFLLGNDYAVDITIEASALKRENNVKRTAKRGSASAKRKSRARKLAKRR